MAPPIPCRIRAPTRKPSVSARPHSIEPMVNTAMAARNTVRVPYRSAIQPLAGMNTARLSKYEVSATFMRTGSTPNTCAMVGSAVAITVESRFCMNSAQATITAVRRVRPLVPAATLTGRVAETAGCSDILPVSRVMRGRESPGAINPDAPGRLVTAAVALPRLPRGPSPSGNRRGR